MPDNTVYVGRPGKFGNPFAGQVDGGESGLATMARQNLVDDFKYWLTVPTTFRLAKTTWIELGPGGYPHHRGVFFKDRDKVLENLHELAGKNLACWCPLSQPCHADVLLEIANGRK